MGEFVNEPLVQILDGYDDASLALLANSRVRSRSETLRLLAERARTEPISLSPIECGMLTAIHLFPATTSLALVAALESWQPHQKLVAALSHLEMRLFVLVDAGRLVLNPLRKQELVDRTALSTLFVPGETLAPDGFCLDTEMIRGLLSIADQTGTLPSRCPLPACGEALTMPVSRNWPPSARGRRWPSALSWPEAPRASCGAGSCASWRCSGASTRPA